MVDMHRPGFGLNPSAPLPGSRRHRADRSVRVVFMGVRRDRAGLLLTTALQAAVLAVVMPGQSGAQTMPSANQLPTGGNANCQVFYGVSPKVATYKTPSIPCSTTAVRVGGLTNGTQYAFMVIAVNEGGGESVGVQTATPVAGEGACVRRTTSSASGQ